MSGGYFEDPSVQDFNKQRALFLKELSANPAAEIPYLSQKLSVPEDRAWSYIKGFLELLAEASFVNGDYLAVKQVINQGIEFEYCIEDSEINRLLPLLERYGDKNIIEKFSKGKELAELRKKQPHVQAHEEAAGQGPNQSNPNQPKIPVSPQQAQSDIAQLNQSPNELNQVGEAPVYDYGSWNSDTLNKGYNYSFFANLTRIGLMRWTLQGLANPPRPSQIESFVRYYELNQDNLMSDPMHLTNKFKEWFGEKTGALAGEMFCSYIRHLKPYEQFGVRKLDGFRGESAMGPQQMGQAGMFQTPAMQFNPMQHYGQQFQDPYNTFYHSEGVLDFGQDARSPDARKAIWEYERDKREQKRAAQKREQLLDDIRTKVQMDMTSFLDQSKRGGFNGNGAMGGGVNNNIHQVMLPAVLSGQVRALPYINAEGVQDVRYEPVAGAAGANGQLHDPQALTARDMLDYVKGMYDLILAERTSKNQVGDTLMDRILARAFPEQAKPPVVELMENWKAIKEISTPQGGWGGQINQTIDMARIMLEEKKFTADKERAEKLLDRQFDQKNKILEIELEREKQANATKNTLIQSVGGAVGSALPNILQIILMLTGKGGAGGMPAAGGAAPGGGFGNLLSSILGGGGLGNLLGSLGGTQGPGTGKGDNPEDSGLPNIGGPGTGPSASDNSGSATEAGMGDLMGLFGNIFNAANPMQQNTQTTKIPAGQQFRPENFIPVNPEPQVLSPTLTAEQMQMRNPENYKGVFDEMSKPEQRIPGTGFMYSGMPTEFNPYANAGVQPMPQQIPVPDQNYDPVREQYARMINNSYGAAARMPQQQPQEVTITNTNPPQGHGQVINLHPNHVQYESSEKARIQQTQEQIEESEDEYRNYTPRDFETLNGDQLEEAYSKGQRSLESIQSYLSSVSQKRNERMKTTKPVKKQQQSASTEED